MYKKNVPRDLEKQTFEKPKQCRRRRHERRLLLNILDIFRILALVSGRAIYDDVKLFFLRLDRKIL